MEGIKSRFTQSLLCIYKKSIILLYTIILDRFRHDFGIRGTALSWLRSFVSNRKQFVAVGAQQSSSTDGSVLGPLLFALYIAVRTSCRRHLGTRLVLP